MSRTFEQTRREPDGYALVCPACGALARRAGAHFCATCGRGLRERTYAPGDALLASYHQQYSRPAMLIEQEMSASDDESALSNSVLDAPRNMLNFGAYAFVIAALVPFVGIVFCLCAVVLGTIGLRNARRARHPGDERHAIYSMVLGVLIFCAQVIFLWLLVLFGII